MQKENVAQGRRHWADTSLWQMPIIIFCGLEWALFAAFSEGGATLHRLLFLWFVGAFGVGLWSALSLSMIVAGAFRFFTNFYRLLSVAIIVLINSAAFYISINVFEFDVFDQRHVVGLTYLLMSLMHFATLSKLRANNLN